MSSEVGLLSVSRPEKRAILTEKMWGETSTPKPCILSKEFRKDEMWRTSTPTLLPSMHSMNGWTSKAFEES